MPIAGCTLVSLVLVLVALAQTPVFDEPVTIDAGGVPINVGPGGNASPFVVDWDRDGMQDLLLGQYYGGRVRFYQNVGTNFEPEFEGFSFLQADGSDVSVSYG
jgi:hypothetical protein